MKPPKIREVCQALKSPPVRGRGLKPGRYHFFCSFMGVAPRAGAWIETSFGEGPLAPVESPPVRGRGLKLAVLALVSVLALGRPPCGGVD